MSITKETPSNAAADRIAAELEISTQPTILQFEKIVGSFPDGVALQDHLTTLTYRALNAAANRLARIMLERWGTAADAPVLFILDHDCSAIVTLFAILKTGRPYLSFHPANPLDRMRAMYSDSRTTGVVSTRRYETLVGELTASQPAGALYLDDIDLDAEAENPGIYAGLSDALGIFYTSGSTGAPQGLVHSHGHVLHAVARHHENWQISPDDRMSLLGSISFAAAPGNILTPLLKGAALCLYDFKTFGPEKTLEWIGSQQITILRQTPSMFRAIFESAPAGLIIPSLRVVTVGGERAKTADFELFKAHTAPHCKFVNVFASTEAGTLAFHVMDHRFAPVGEFLPAGRPILGKEVMIMDDEGRVLGPGEEGEIVVRSRLLSSGYWNNPAQTAARFAVDPNDSGSRILYTGDLGAWLDDGTLDYRGRKDAGAKIRGFRVDLSEIETSLHTHPLIRQAVVVVRPARHRPDQSQLIAYVVPRSGEALTSATLRVYLAARLPDYSIPSFFVFLEQLPLNAHGKVDARALPEVPERPGLSASDLPSDVVEQRLMEIWQGVLKIENVGVNDNFFDLGGDSLSVLSMTLDTEKQLSRKVPRAFFRQPTIRNLAGLLHEQDQGDTQPEAAFNLSGHQEPISNPAWKRQLLVQRIIRRLRRQVKDLLMTMDEVYFFKWLLFRFIRNMPVRKANELIFQLANSNILLNSVFRRKDILFRRFLSSLDIAPQHSRELFRANFTANMLFEMLHTKRPFQEALSEGTDHSSAGSTYFLDRRNLLDETPRDQLDEFFPVAGIHHLEDAINEQRGVILLAFHGTAANRVAHRMLARRLGIARIQTITYHAPLEQSPFSGAGAHIPTVVAGSLYAEAAFHGQNLLQHGQVLHILGDTIATGPGRRYPLRIGDRLYTIKAGFAELALNTGAKVIPLFGRFVDGGRLLVEFLPALQATSGSRDEQIRSLLEQYETFIGETIRRHPEMINWRKMGKHVRLPRWRRPAAPVSAQLG